MRKEQGTSKKGSPALPLCVFGFCLILVLLFGWYRGKLNQEFDQLVRESLTAYAEGQHQEVQSTISDLQGTMNAIVTMLETSGIDPESTWMINYLSALGERQSPYAISYTKLDELEDLLKGADIRQEDKDFLGRLTQGETVISNVRQSARLGERYYFSIAMPVYKEGRAIGVLWGLLEAKTLVQTIQRGYFHDSVDSYVIKTDGSFVVVKGEGTQKQVNLFVEMSNQVTNLEDTKELQAAVSRGESETYRVPMRDGSVYFVSVASLGYNDWNIINFTRAEEVSRHSNVILRDTMLICALLMTATAAAGIGIYQQTRGQRHQLDFEHARYAILSNFSDTVLFEYKYGTDTAVFTPNALEMLDIDSLEIKNFIEKGWKGLLYPEDEVVVRTFLQTPPGADQRGQRDLRLKGKQGRYVWCRCQYQAVCSKRGQEGTLLCKLVNIDEQKQREQGLIERSETDGLTGLSNKYTVTTRITHYLEQEQNAGYLFMIDIDDFKQINDKLGHQAGDQAIACIGKVLRTVFREGDFLGRVGGDEFVVFMTGTQDRKAVQRKAERLVEKITLLGRESGGVCGFSCSIGIAACPKNGREFETLFCAADQAMYQAKQNGKHAYHFAGEE